MRSQVDGDWTLRITGTAGRLSAPPQHTLAVGNAGAVLRLLLGIGALLPEITLVTDHPDSLGRRPNADLLAALTQLGVQVEANGPDGLLPITLRGGPPAGGAVTVSGARSSQYLSALLYLAPLLSHGTAHHRHRWPALGRSGAGDAARAGGGGHRRRGDA